MTPRLPVLWLLGRVVWVAASVGTNQSSTTSFCFPEYEEGCRAWLERQQQRQDEQQQQQQEEEHAEQERRRLRVRNQKLAGKMSQRRSRGGKMAHASKPHPKGDTGGDDDGPDGPEKEAQQSGRYTTGLRVSAETLGNEFQAFRARIPAAAAAAAAEAEAEERSPHPAAPVGRLNEAFGAGGPSYTSSSGAPYPNPRDPPQYRGPDVKSGLAELAKLGEGALAPAARAISYRPRQQQQQQQQQQRDVPAEATSWKGFHGDGVSRPGPAPANVSAVSVRSHAMCKRASSIYMRLVHIPKAGGMSLCCTYNANQVAKKNGKQTYGDINGCGRVAAADVAMSLQGQNHETYFEIAKEKRCSHNLYLRGGSNCAVTPRCEPMVVMMAHPADRFFAAFFQKFGQSDRLGRVCGFLNCKPRSELASKYSSREISPDGFALWENKEDFKAGFNEATKFFGLDNLFHFPKHPVPRERTLLDDAEGRAALRTAKKRLANMDFVGLTSRFVESMELLSWTLGIPLNQFCSCNINAFKSPKYGMHASDMSADAKAAILSDNSLDKELYDYAVEIFEERYAEFATAVGKRERTQHGFECDTKAMLCKGDRGGWIPADKYKQDNERAIYNGKHSYCAFKCQRKGYEPPADYMPAPSMFGAVGSMMFGNSSTAAVPNTGTMGGNRMKRKPNVKVNLPAYKANGKFPAAAGKRTGGGVKGKRSIGNGGKFAKFDRGTDLYKQQERSIEYAKKMGKAQDVSARNKALQGRHMGSRSRALPEPPRARGWF